ncbi:MULTISPECIES: hypothetical protein [unclassified Caballeronia]|uniref:hypothetical protein n=1 Tax=unclassified Caballeronia TaxID=2646786 RepID=UPI00285C190E|nr:MULTISPECIES: hypothetical protein [unclassified Caballeronia]MDR5755240.1 hypothetical protein [Caballeronia sp. LZ024]MDR5845107.1 hypothetical protein [Caballeronia sp. LZ031]
MRRDWIPGILVALVLRAPVSSLSDGRVPNAMLRLSEWSVAMGQTGSFGTSFDAERPDAALHASYMSRRMRFGVASAMFHHYRALPEQHVQEKVNLFDSPAS